MTIKITVTDKPVDATYQNVSGVIGAGGVGAGAEFDVVKVSGKYTVTLDKDHEGSGYVAGDTVTIAGANLGGATPANNLIVTVGTVGLGGKIATFGTVGSGRVGDGNIDILVDVDGTKGVDNYTFTGKSSEYTLTHKDNDIIASSKLASNLTFTLHDHERVTFDDKHLAFDVTKDNDLGKILALMAAAVGEDDVTADYIGAGMYLKENLGWSVKEIAAKILASDEYLKDAGGASNAIFAKHVWKNVFGRDGTYDEITAVVDVIEKHHYTQADVLMVAANRPELLGQIDFVGIQSSGLEFVPFGG
jgi:hypothetical protein